MSDNSPSHGRVLDEEKLDTNAGSVHVTLDESFSVNELGAGAAARKSGILGKMWGIVKKIDKYGIEIRGIERVLPHERTPLTSRDMFDNLWFWLAANCQISALALGILGPSVFLLSGRVSILVIILFNLLGTLPVSFFSTFGPKLGLRQMTISRFSFGYYVASFPVALNVIGCLGYCTINSIVASQALRAVSTTHQIPIAAGVIIVAVLTFFAPFFGYKVVHTYERYSWIPIPGLSVRYMDLGSIISPVDVTGDVLSFGAAVLGFGISWSSCAADYTVQMPVDVSSSKIFWLSYLGLNTPLILVQSLGAGIATVTRSDWQDAFASGGVGGLIGATLSPAGGFGGFCLVIMAMSVVSNNVPSIYSFALTFQVLGRYAQAIPRVFLVLFGTIIYVVLAIIGASHFESWLDTLLVILSYWLTIYCAILTEEHFIFRKGRWENYNVADYNNPSKLPLGLAAAVSTCLGIMGAVLGMATEWYIGVLGKKIGDPIFGGDIGFELSMAFTSISYPILRALELKWGGPLRRGEK